MAFEKAKLFWKTFVWAGDFSSLLPNLQVLTKSGHFGKRSFVVFLDIFHAPLTLSFAAFTERHS